MDEHEARRDLRPAAAPPLPPERAFVVQLRPGASEGERVAGRVEHIASGMVGRFSSASELIEFLVSVPARVSPDGKERP